MHVSAYRSAHPAELLNCHCLQKNRTVILLHSQAYTSHTLSNSGLYTKPNVITGCVLSMSACHSSAFVCISVTCGQQNDCVICVKINSEKFPWRRFFVAMRWWNRFIGTVNTARDGRPRNRGSIPCGGKKFHFSPKRPDRFWTTFSILFIGFLGLLSGVKGSQREADHLPYIP